MEILSNEAYKFLKEDDDLKNIIYLVLSGSYGYGTNKEDSDIDLRGVLIEKPKYIFGIDNFEQYENNELDIVIYGLKKFISLCINSNPNALELLGVSSSEIILMDERGKILRDNTDLFLTKKVIKSFGNYAIAQLRRLSNGVCRGLYNENEKENHLKNSLNMQMDHIKKTYKDFSGDYIDIYLNENQKLSLDIKMKNYPLRDFLKIYSELNNTLKSYEKINHRNNKKTDEKLFKHAMHLIRLLITGTDILKNGKIITKRKKEIDFLMDIRNGIYSYEELFIISEEYINKFYETAKNCKLPESPDLKKIENLMLEIYRVLP